MAHFYVYRLKFRKGTVFLGVTDDMNNARKDHIKGTKLFSSMETVHETDTKKKANELKAALLQEHRNINFGKNPKYN